MYEDKISLWSAPNWHSDYVNSFEEFNSLKKIAIIVLNSNPSLNITYQIIEEGYQSILILNKKKYINC